MEESLLAKACNFNTPPAVFFMFFKIVQMVPNCPTHHLNKILKISENWELIPGIFLKT